MADVYNKAAHQRTLEATACSRAARAYFQRPENKYHMTHSSRIAAQVAFGDKNSMLAHVCFRTPAELQLSHDLIVAETGSGDAFWARVVTHAELLERRCDSPSMWAPRDAVGVDAVVAVQDARQPNLYWACERMQPENHANNDDMAVAGAETEPHITKGDICVYTGEETLNCLGRSFNALVHEAAVSFGQLVAAREATLNTYRAAIGLRPLTKQQLRQQGFDVSALAHVLAHHTDPRYRDMKLVVVANTAGGDTRFCAQAVPVMRTIGGAQVDCFELEMSYDWNLGLDSLLLVNHISTLLQEVFPNQLAISSGYNHTASIFKGRLFDCNLRAHVKIDIGAPEHVDNYLFPFSWMPSFHEVIEVVPTRAHRAELDRIAY